MTFVPRMPCQPKEIQKELEQGLFWPLYWIYGQESMKTRELLKRIKAAVLGSGKQSALLGLAEDVLDGSEVESQSVVESAQTLSFGGGVKLVIVKEAHLIRNPEVLGSLFGKRAKLSELTSVCVCIAKELDGRKKFTKQLLEGAAVVSCEPVLEADREAWIQYLLKRRGLQLPGDLIAQLSSLDPWSLDLVDQELEKYSLYNQAEVLGGTFGAVGASGELEPVFLCSFFERKKAKCLPMVEEFANIPGDSLKILGTLAWHVRQIAQILYEKNASIQGTASVRHFKINTYALSRIQPWLSHWTLDEILMLQEDLQQMDFFIKQSSLLEIGIWAELVHRYGR